MSKKTKTIFITGGGSGIGRAIAQRYAREGWLVGLGDVDEAGMAETAALLPAGMSSSHRLDVRNSAEWRAALAEFAERSGGRLDVLANNAGVGHGGTITELSEAQIDQLVDVNLKGVIHGARAAHPWLLASAPGSCLINTASASALYGIGGMSVYSATKFAVRALTEALDTEWQDDGIKVAALFPGFIDTPLLAQPANQHSNIPKRETVIAAGMPFVPVEDVAEAAWQAAHDRKMHHYIGSTARQMALAARFAPAYLRRRSRKLMKVRLGE
ncbi:MAG TPA: SDR family oxidoreductase [Sphingomonadaceae bacterium]|nr:SDR family oxidoreductase [Sphingomonadaceae bacterium]